MKTADLAHIRQLEALMARAWPAADFSYNGTWVVRHTPGCLSKQLNSVTPLDPADDKNLIERMKVLSTYLFRQTPLCPPAMLSWFSDHHWLQDEATTVMTALIPESFNPPASFTIKQCSTQDYAALSHEIRGNAYVSPPVMEALLERIKAERYCFGLFINNEPAGHLLAVKDGAFTGFPDYALKPEFYGKDYKKAFFHTAMLDMAAKGTKKFWLQVKENNSAAFDIFTSLNFNPVYTYSYWKAPH